MSEQKLLTMPELPILKHLELPTEAGKSATNTTTWKKGEKGVSWIVGLALMALIGYGLVTILPIVLVALGKTIAAIGIFFLVALAFMMWPVVYKGFRRIVRWAHRGLIKVDPFAELEDQLSNMKRSRAEFDQAKNEINSCKIQMKQSALDAEKNAKLAQEKVLDKQEEAKMVKAKLDGMISAKGEQIRETDEFVVLENRMNTAIGDGNRAMSESQTYASLVNTFASRANVFGKLDRKLVGYGHAFDEKIKDFDMSIKNLRTVSTGMSAANNATTRARNVLNNQTTWELDYAMEVITSQIAGDIASTQANIRDLDNIVKDFNPNDERAYARLESFANQIKAGESEVADPNRVANPNYTLSQDQRNASGGLGDIF